MSFSNYLENALLNHTFKVSAFTQPTNLYVALFTSDPGETGATGEVSGNGYARKLFNTWTTASTGSLANNGAITFSPASGGAWGTVTHFGIFDANTSGNFICGGILGASKSIADGDTAEFANGALTVALD